MLAATVTACAALACYALESIPGAEAKEINYNAVRTAQEITEGNEHAVANGLVSGLFGRVLTDGINAFSQVRKNGGSMGEAIMTGAYKAFLSSAYEDCLRRSQTSYDTFACGAFKP